MKTNRLILILSILILTLVGCENPNSATNEPPAPKPVYKCVHCEENTVETENTICTTCKTEKINLYKRYLGTWEYEFGADGWEEYDKVSSQAKFWYTFTFAMNKISANYDVGQAFVEYPFNPDTDLYFEEEVPEEWRWEGEDLYFHVNDKYYSFIDKTTYLKVSFPLVSNYDGRNTALPNCYIKKIGSGSGDGEENLDFSVVGDWKYKINGTTDSTLKIKNDGNFSFITISGTYNGSYSVSGNKITFEFDQNASMNIKDTFTISGSENEITLTLVESISTYNGDEQKSTTLSGMLNVFYGVVTSTTITLSK